MSPVVFTTLFLALTNGPQTVTLACSAEIARVELRLDDELVHHFDGPPWTTRIDLGPDLAPHHLVATAHDAQGAVSGRAEQWINLPRSRSEAALFVDHDGEGGRFARVSWLSVDHAEAVSAQVLLDGVPLSFESLERVPLPASDPGTLHILSAVITFSDATSVRADAAFGGPYGEETVIELTGIPVQVEGRRRLRRATEAGAWLEAEGKTRPVMAIDQGAATIYALLDESAQPHLLQLGRDLARSSPWHRDAGLLPGDRLHVVYPSPRVSPSGTLLFESSPPLEHWRVGGSAWLLTHLRLVDRAGPQRLADAVATAGLEASSGGRPRAVLLVLGPTGHDASGYSAAAVRAYLEHLRVPLAVAFVEQPGLGPSEEDREARRGRLEAARATWGPEVHDIAGLRDWISLHRDLRDAIAHQRILWIEGFRPPGDVRLVGAPKWLQPLPPSAP